MTNKNIEENNKQCECNKAKVVNDLLKRISNLEFEVEDKDRENERLNNIINELERKMLNDKLYIEDISKKQTYPIEEFRIRNPYTTGSYDTCVNYLGKIKELKGESNEED